MDGLMALDLQTILDVLKHPKLSCRDGWLVQFIKNWVEHRPPSRLDNFPPLLSELVPESLYMDFMTDSATRTALQWFDSRPKLPSHPSGSSDSWMHSKPQQKPLRWPKVVIRLSSSPVHGSTLRRLPPGFFDPGFSCDPRLSTSLGSPHR